MSCNCETYQCLSVDYNPCSNGVELPINADETADWRVLIEFNGTWITLSIEVTDGEPIIIPNVLNERYVHTIRLLNSDKELFNDTCYKLITGNINSGQLTPSGTGAAVKETYRLDITITDDTSQSFPALISGSLLEVYVEGIDIGANATLNTNTGIVTWNYAVGIDQTGYILYKK